MTNASKELVVTDVERVNFIERAFQKRSQSAVLLAGTSVVADYAIRQIHAARQEKPLIDWRNDEAVVRAAVPSLIVYGPSGDGCSCRAEGFHAYGNLEVNMWRSARQHPTVQAFELLHNPALQPDPQTSDDWTRAFSGQGVNEVVTRIEFAV
jgi:hypothetical protein